MSFDRFAETTVIAALFQLRSPHVPDEPEEGAGRGGRIPSAQCVRVGKTGKPSGGGMGQGVQEAEAVVVQNPTSHIRQGIRHHRR